MSATGGAAAPATTAAVAAMPPAGAAVSASPQPVGEPDWACKPCYQRPPLERPPPSAEFIATYGNWSPHVADLGDIRRDELERLVRTHMRGSLGDWQAIRLSIYIREGGRCLLCWRLCALHKRDITALERRYGLVDCGEAGHFTPDCNVELGIAAKWQCGFMCTRCNSLCETREASLEFCLAATRGCAHHAAVFTEWKHGMAQLERFVNASKQGATRSVRCRSSSPDGFMRIDLSLFHT